MVRDHSLRPVPTHSVLVDGKWHDTVAYDSVEGSGSCRYFFSDGTFVDVTDGEHSDVTVRSPSEDPFGMINDGDNSHEGDVVMCGVISHDNDPPCVVGDSESDEESSKIDSNSVVPKVCGLVDHCTQDMMEGGGSVCSLSGSDDDMWEP